MFGWFDEDGGSKIFWFETTKGGYQKLVRPDGTSKIIKKKHEIFAEMGPQSLAGWQRAMLLMEEYGYWDATAFGCSVHTLIGVRTSRYEEESPVKNVTIKNVKVGEVKKFVKKVNNVENVVEKNVTYEREVK